MGVGGGEKLVNSEVGQCLNRAEIYKLEWRAQRRHGGVPGDLHLQHAGHEKKPAGKQELSHR